MEENNGKKFRIYTPIQDKMKRFVSSKSKLESVGSKPKTIYKNLLGAFPYKKSILGQLDNSSEKTKLIWYEVTDKIKTG